MRTTIIRTRPTKIIAPAQIDFAETKTKIYRGPGRRELTFAEQKVDWGTIESNIDDLEAKLRSQLGDVFNPAVDKFIKKLNIAVAKNEIQSIKNIPFEVVEGVRRSIKDLTSEAYDIGKDAVAKEMKRPNVSRPNDARNLLDAQAYSIAQGQSASLEQRAKQTLTDMMLRLESGVAAIAAVKETMDRYVEQYIQQTSGIVIAGSFNSGRRRTQDAYGDDIYALQRSEILDKRTCNFCLSVDGRIVDKRDPFARNNQFHTGCRGVWVEILVDEQFKPAIGGIPNSLRSKVGNGVNDLIQPKNPVTKQNTASRQYVRRKNSQ